MEFYIGYLYTSRKRFIQLGGEVLYSILNEFGILMKLVTVIKVCLNEIYSNVCLGKYLSYAFPVQNGLKEGVAFFFITFQLCFIFSRS